MHVQEGYPRVQLLCFPPSILLAPAPKKLGSDPNPLPQASWGEDSVKVCVVKVSGRTADR